MLQDLKSITFSGLSSILIFRLWKCILVLQIERIVAEQVQYAKMGIGKDSWQLFSEEGEMKMYRREEEVNGLVIDPLKACHYVQGFSAHEMCHYFFEPEYRYEWESRCY